MWWAPGIQLRRESGVANVVGTSGCRVNCPCPPDRAAGRRPYHVMGTYTVLALCVVVDKWLTQQTRNHPCGFKTSELAAVISL